MFIENPKKLPAAAEKKMLPAVQKIAEEQTYVGEVLKGMKEFDPTTHKHLIETANLAFLISKKIDLSQEETRLLVEAALVHDKGKMDINPGILFKQGELSEDDWREVSKHVRETFNHVKKHGRHETAKITVAHHDHDKSRSTSRPNGERRQDEEPIQSERRNGSDRREDDPQLNKLSRILSIIDSFEALRSPRHYKESMPLEKCEEILLEKFTKDKDKKIIEALIEIVKEN
jgi:HD-GYP domain-containing protein (c-di-GMP phosphodiesterase class II)